MLMTRRIVFVFLALVLALGGCQLDTGVKIIKMGHAQVVSHPVHQAMVFLGKRLEEKSGGKIKVKVYPNQQLGTERELLELLQIGSVGMTKVSAASLEAFSPEISVLGLPYLFRDDAHITQVLEGEIGKELLLSTEKYWLRGLCFYDAGKRSFYSKTKPIATPADLAGLKVRVQESKMAINMVRGMGGSPTRCRMESSTLLCSKALWMPQRTILPVFTIRGITKFASITLSTSIQRFLMWSW